MGNNVREDTKNTSKEVETSAILLEKLEGIEAELMRKATVLKEEINTKISRPEQVTKQFPPMFMQVIYGNKPFQNRIVWSKYTTKKYNMTSGKRRASKEIPGRRGKKYRSYIFDCLDEPIRSEAIKAEDQAAKLRHKLAFWASVHKQAKSIVDGDA
jgi:hypothetical protein